MNTILYEIDARRDLRYSTFCVSGIAATKMLDTILYHGIEGN